MLYWMARYVERAENHARILDVAYRMSLLTKDPNLQDQEWFAPLNITGTLFPFSGRHSLVCAKEVLHFMALDPENPTSIYNCAKQARENARAVRGTITSEMWEVLNSTWIEMQNMDEDRLYARGVSAFFEWVKERSHLFRGVTSARFAVMMPSSSTASAPMWKGPTTPRALLTRNTISCCPR
jgi:uncharacterized alpha-E superfamily protein